MPLFKGKASKSTPNKAIAYITNPQKAALVSVRNLFEDENYAKQFTRTMRRFGKGKKRDERKYYHFKLSCDRKDKVTPEKAQFTPRNSRRVYSPIASALLPLTRTQRPSTAILSSMPSIRSRARNYASESRNIRQ